MLRILIAIFLLMVPYLAITEDRYAWQWIEDESFLSSYRKISADHSLPLWATSFNGPSGLSYSVEISNTEYAVVHTCKSHDCARMNITVLYSAIGDTFALVNGNISHYMGSPSPELQTKMLELHQNYYKSSNVRERLHNSN